MIEIEHLVKRYGSHMAVDDLSLLVEPGKIYGFLGPNGAGKSTTMNIITGYLAATAGTVKINGADVALEPEKAKQCVGYLPELPPLYMDMTVKEYLDFAAELKKIEKGKRAKQVAEAMEMTGITDVSGRLIRNLSKGYKQRVGFAQAVLGKPEIIILDEPTVGLDPKQIIEIRDLIKKLGESQHGEPVRTHDGKSADFSSGKGGGGSSGGSAACPCGSGAVRTVRAAGRRNGCPAYFRKEGL